jgi:hypothetical protein
MICGTLTSSKRRNLNPILSYGRCLFVGGVNARGQDWDWAMSPKTRWADSCYEPSGSARSAVASGSSGWAADGGFQLADNIS